MDNRLSNLYMLLAKQEKTVEISQLAKRFQVSTRTIYNDINKLNELLIAAAQEEIIIEKARVYYDVIHPVPIESLLFKNSDFVSSDKHIRRNRILVCMLLAGDILTQKISCKIH